jgi:hypothetical protein
MVLARTSRRIPAVAASCLIAGLVLGGAPGAAAAGPNTVAQWNQIAENTVVASGAFQNEGLIYMAYTQAAVYDAVVAIEGQAEPYGPALEAPAGASPDAAVIQAAYETLAASFPTQEPALAANRAASLGAIADGSAKDDGIAVGHTAAAQIIAMRTGDGRRTPIGSTSALAPMTPRAGLWRLTPTAYAAPQTPWVANVQPFVVPSADQYLPPPPPALDSLAWVLQFDEIKAVGSNTSSVRTADQTAVALFWSANVIRQYNRLVRDIAASHSLGLLQTARLAAMVDVVGADAQISVMYAKYHYRFWRPVTAIDPSSVNPAGDGFGPVPGFDDGNEQTAEQAGWRPLLTTPNHPEYPAAHGSITSAIAEVLADFLGTNRIEIDIHGFDPAGPAGNLNAVRHFERVVDLRQEIVNARLWAGLHFRGSSVAGVDLGRSVAKYDLRHAFELP